MPTNDVQRALDDALCGRRLLDHPFYKRWEAGELAATELTAYAEQYRHVEAALPGALTVLVEAVASGTSRSLIEENLTDERQHPCAHTELFESFADAVGADKDVAAMPAMRDLVSLYTDSARANPIAGLSVIAAYEVQAAAIAASKGDGLRTHYDLDDAGTAFWDVHRSLEAQHATWSCDALGGLGATYDEVFHAARSSADAWWAFLDEREELAAA